MTIDELKTRIAERVFELQGCKAVELYFMDELVFECRRSADPRARDIPAIIEEMVSEGKLVKVEYLLPNMNYRIKSFLLPAGTVVK